VWEDRLMNKLISLAAALVMAVSLTFVSADDAEARGRGRWIAGLALGLAAAAIIHRHHRRHHYYYYDDYGYYPSYGYYYYPRRHWRHRHFHRHYGHRHHRRWRGHSFY
jgi:hypothetical protein